MGGNGMEKELSRAEKARKVGIQRQRAIQERIDEEITRKNAPILLLFNKLKNEIDDYIDKIITWHENDNYKSRLININMFCPRIKFHTSPKYVLPRECNAYKPVGLKRFDEHHECTRELCIEMIDDHGKLLLIEPSHIIDLSFGNCNYRNDDFFCRVYAGETWYTEDPVYFEISLKNNFLPALQNELNYLTNR